MSFRFYVGWIEFEFVPLCWAWDGSEIFLLCWLGDEGSWLPPLLVGRWREFILLYWWRDEANLPSILVVRWVYTTMLMGRWSKSILYVGGETKLIDPLCWARDRISLSFMLGGRWSSRKRWVGASIMYLSIRSLRVVKAVKIPYLAPCYVCWYSWIYLVHDASRQEGILFVFMRFRRLVLTCLDVRVYAEDCDCAYLSK